MSEERIVINGQDLLIDSIRKKEKMFFDADSNEFIQKGYSK